MWDPQIPELAESFRVVAIDHLGHGESPAPQGPYDMQQLGTSVISVMDHLAIARAHVVGISMGGHLALWLAVHHPERILNVVVMCTAASFGGPRAWKERSDVVEAEGTSGLAHSVADRWLTPEFSQAHPRMHRWIIDMVTGTSDIGYAGCCAALGTSDLSGDLHRITSPVLAIAADRDLGNPVANLAFIADEVQQGSLQVVQNAAHLCNVEQPEQVTELIMEHLHKKVGA